MKKLILLLVICFCSISCVEIFLDDDINYPDTGEPATFHEIHIGNNSAAGNNILETSLGKFSVQESAAFQLQAQHYNISELQRDSETGEIIYRYQPPHGYVGEDYVEILAPTDRNGNRIFETKIYEFQIYVGN